MMAGDKRFVLNEEDRTLGRRKRRYEEEYVPLSIYPLCRGVTENASSTSEGRHIFTARLCPSAELGVAKTAAVTSPEEIDVLRKYGFYGYAPGEERWQPESLDAVDRKKPDVIYLFDAEIFFLLHSLDCLRVEIPRNLTPTQANQETSISPVRVLWDLLCTDSASTADQAGLTAPLLSPSISPASACPFSARYAAYVYYRSRGWIVRPALSLGAVDYLLYAQGPPWRHAAYAVLVLCDRTAESITTSSVTAHLRVISGVSKELILCWVREEEEVDAALFVDRPWDMALKSSVQETLVSRNLQTT
ncbi:tRNA-splicing endonuclease subunit Sen2 [Sparganum proliferum]